MTKFEFIVALVLVASFYVHLGIYINERIYARRERKERIDSCAKKGDGEIRWLSVEECLPKDYENVLVCGTRISEVRVDCISCLDRKFICYGDRVEYWAPMPKAPVEYVEEHAEEHAEKHAEEYAEENENLYELLGIED